MKIPHDLPECVDNGERDIGEIPKRWLRYGEPAAYREERSPKFRNNVLVRAMPELLSREKTYDVLSHMPEEREVRFLNEPLEYRLDYVTDLREVYIPTETHVDAFGLLMRAIRNGYQFRDPRDPRVMRFILELSESEDPTLLPRLNPTGGGSNGIMLIGTTGVGKTSWADRFIEYIGSKAKIHFALNGRRCYWPQVIVIRIQASETKTVGGIASAIAAQADAMTGGRWKALLRGKPHRGDILIICCQIICSLMVGILIIEDLQLLKSVGSGATEILDFLANIMEITGMPVASISTCKVTHVVKSNTAVGSKLTAGGVREFFPVLYGKDFNNLIVTYWALRVTKGGDVMPAWLPELVHAKTGGIRRFLRELFEYLFEQMATQNISVPNKAFVKQCAAKSIGRYAPAVDALRRAQEKGYLSDEELLLYEDMFNKIEATSKAPIPHLPVLKYETAPEGAQADSDSASTKRAQTSASNTPSRGAVTNKKAKSSNAPSTKVAKVIEPPDRNPILDKINRRR